MCDIMKLKSNYLRRKVLGCLFINEEQYWIVCMKVKKSYLCIKIIENMTQVCLFSIKVVNFMKRVFDKTFHFYHCAIALSRIL